MELQSLLSNFNSPKEGLEYLKDRTNNNVNWENLSKASEEIAKNQGGDKDSIALQIIGQYSQGENPLFNFEELKAPPAIQGKDLQKYDTNITSLEGIKNLGLDVIDTLGLTGFSENASKRRQDTMRYLQQSAKDNIPYNNLDEQSYWALSGMKGSAVSRHEYENLKKTQELISKTENDLTQDDKNFINKQLNPISHFFSDYTKEDFEEFKDKATQDLVNADVQSKLNFLNTIHQEKSITSILTGSDEKTKNDYLQAVQTIAKEAGFEGIAYDKKGDVFFYDHENFYKPNQDFFGNFLNILASNAGSIGGGITGAIVGAKNAKNPQQALIGSVVGAGIGSFIGASSDVLLTNSRLNRENTLKEVLAHSLEEGTLSVVGDLAIMGGAMAVKNGLKILKDSNVAQKTSETFKNIVEYTPIIGFVSRFQDGNAKSALKLVSNTIDETQQKALHDFGESFGGNIKFGSQDNFRAYENIKAKFGENHFVTKGAKIINDAFMLKSQSQAQKTILQAIRADESGNLVAFLSEAANASPTLQNSLKSLLNQTTFNLKKQLEYLDLKPNEVKEIFDTFQKGTKTEYAQAIDEVLTKVYDDTYKVKIDPSKYNNFRIQLEQSGVLPEDSLRFLEFAQKNIYNQQGVSFTQLNNALKQINSYYKTATDPNFKDFTAKAVENFLRDDIKQGIDSIFAQNKTLYKDAQSLFSSALSDYGKMKATLKLVDKIKLRDESISYEQAFKNLYKYVKGQGGELQNLTKLTQHLDKNSAQRVELSILYNLFNQNIKDFKDIQVFDSQAFFKNLESIKDHFNTQSAKDFIDIAKGFDTLFKNDVLIANAIRNATTDKISSSIATTIQGAVKFQIVRMMFENIVRLLPNIPFMSSLNEKVQGASLRFHIRSALMKNLDVQDFKISLSNKAKYNKEFNSQTKQALENIIGKIDKAQDEMLEVAQRNTKQAQNAKDLQEYQTLQKYGVESLQKLSQDDFNHFVDSVLSGDIEALKSAPNIVYIADLNADLAKELGLNNGKIFFKKNDLHHSRNERKGTYNQDLNKDEIKQLPKTITENKNIYVDKVHNNFFITKELNENEIAMFVANKDELGNYVIHIKRVLKSDLNKSEYSKVGSGIEPHIERSTSITPPSHLGHLPPNAPKMQVHSQAIGESHTLSLKKSEPMHPDTPLENADTIIPQKTNDDINASIQKQTSSNINSTLQNPSIEFALQEFPEFSKAELEEMLTKGIRGEARTKEGITKQDIEYFKDNTFYKSEIANYRDEELGMYGDTFLGKYSKELETMPKYFESQSVDELSTKVAKALEKNGLLPNEEEANLALLGHLAKNSNGENIAKVLTKVYQSNDRETFTKIKDMFVKNAGEFHNLVNDIGEHGLKKLELRPYLLDSINATSQSLRGTRANNFKRLAEKIDNVLKTTTKEGRNVLIESDREFYKNLIGEILGASLAKFARQENPANALYEVLKNAKADLVEALEPTLFKEGKGIENADIYDLLELLISKGEPSEPTSAVIDMLPALREKEEAYKVYITQEGEFYVHKRNNRNTSNDILNTSSHWDNMVSHRDDKMQDKYSIDTEGESTSRGEVEEFRGVGNKATHPQRTKEIRDKNKGIARELKDIQKKTDNSRIIYNNGFKGGEVAGASDILESGGTTTKPSDLQITYPANHSSGKNPKADSTTKNTKYTIRELKTPSDEELKQITQAYTQDNELLKQRKEIIQSYSNKIEKTKSKKIKQRLEDEWLEKLGQINRKIDDDYALFLRKNGVDTKAMDIKRELEISERYAKPLFDLLEGFSDKELREYKVRYKYTDTYRDSYLDVGDKRFTEGKGLSISKLQNILLTKLNMSEYPKEIQYAYFDSPLFHHARWNKIETKPDSELIYLGGLSFDEMAMNRERKDLEYLFDIKPIKEFGTNYAEFYKDGKGAIQKLLSEAKDYETRKEAGSLTEDEVKQGAYKGQVAGAFYKEGLGDIDLVWGDSKMGLAHILERRMQDFIEKGFSKAEAEQKALEFAKSLPDIIENGNIDKRIARAFLETQDSKAVIALDFNDKDNKWILTAYNKDDALNPAYSHQVKHNTNTSSETRASGDKEIIPQNANTINILKDMQDKDINVKLDNKELQSEKQGSNSASLTKGETLPLNSKEDSTIKNTNELEKPTTKNYSLLRDDGFVKQQKKQILKNEQIAKQLNIDAKRFEKEGDKEAVEILQETAQAYKEIAQKLREDLPRIIEFQGYKPLSEFGTNYTEFIGDGKGAIQKLLSEAKDYETRKEAGSLTEDEVKQGAYKGQVAGAFHKEGLGDIDLVWGEVTDAINHKGYGLAHILDKRKAEFIEKGFSNTEAEHKTLELIKKIPSVIDNGQIVDLKNGKIRIVTEDYTIGMKNEWHDNPTNPYILTTFENNKKSDKNLHSTAFTKGETLPLNSKEDSTIKNTNPTQNTSMIHTKEAIKQYLQGFSKHLSNQSKQQIPSVLKEIDSFTNANDIVQYTGAFKKEIQQFIPYLETKEKLEQVLQTPKLQRDPKENLEVSITRIDEKPSKIHLAFDEKGYIPYDTHIAEEFLKQPTTNKDTSTLIDTFIKGAYKKAEKDLSDTYLLDLTGSKIDFGEDITLLNGRELYYKDKQINNEYTSPSVLINTAKKLKEGLSDSDLYLAHANKDNLANYHYPYNLLNEYLEDISLLSDWGLADLLVDKSIKQPFNQALDKAFKANGEPFGVLWNNEATKKNLEQNLADYGISINPKDFFVGKNAIDFLLDKQSGYIQSAFHKEGLGDIDLVWGDSKMGLAHILERRTDDFIKQGLSKEEAQTKARELIGQIPEILEQSTIYRQNDSKIELITSRHTLVLGLRDDRKFIITELIDKRNKKRLGSSQTGVADTLTDETLTNKSLSSSQHLDASTTPADPHQSGFVDSNFSTSLKSEAKNDFNPTTKDLIQQSKYLSKIMDLNKKNNKGTLDKKNKLIQEFKQKEPQIYQAMVRKEVYRHYHNKGLYLDDHIVDPDDFLDQYNYIYKREQARQNQNHKHHIETKLEQYKEELENILNNLDSIKNPITQLKKLNLKIAKLPIKQAFGDPVHKDAVLSLSDTIDTALSDIFAKLPQYTENKKQILQESKTKTQEFITYMQEVRGDIDYMLDVNPKAIKPYMQERLKEAKPYEKKFLERIQDQVKQIEEKNKDSAPNLGTKEIIKQAKASGKSVAETKELLQKHKEKDSIQDNPQVSALQTKIQQTRQQIAEIPNPDKEYLHQVLKPDEIIQLEKQYFNQAMPQEYKELIQDFPSLYEQSLANKLKTYVKDTDTIQEVTTNLLNDFKDKPFKDTAKHAELLLFNTLKDKAQELGFKELDINEPSFKVAFGKFQARLKKGDIQDLSEHIAINSLRKNRLRIQEELNINPIKEFGTNYAEHYHSGESAIAKLLAERQGQVAGAFYRKELGDIDLVWGDSKMGLAHILERRTDDFIKQGLSKEEAEAKAKEFVKEIPQIIENGEVVENAGVKTIILKDKNIEHRVGLSKGFNGKGENEWILTAYKRENPHAQNFDQVTNSKELESGNNLSLMDSAPNPTTKDLIKEVKEQDLSVKETKEAMQDSTQATQDLTHLKQKLENASDEEKGEIIKETITEQNNKLLEEITKLQNVLEKKDFLPFEIDEKIKSLSTKSQFIGEDEESLKKVAISQLEFETKDKIKELQKILKDNKIGLGTLKEFLTKAKDPKIIENKAAYESVKATLKRIIEKNQKRVLKILDNAIQERKLTYYLNTKDGEERGRKLFYSFKPDTEQIELFEKIFPIAQKLGVEVKQAINNEFLSKEADGVYYSQGNSVRVKNNRIYQEKGKVFLHELIHSVTSRAMIAYESGKRELLSPNQIIAINNIQKLYKEVHKNHKELGFETFESFFTGHKGDYGLKNSHEFVAELSNPIFREKLKKVGVFEKLVDNILRLFVSAKEALGLAKTNAYESLKKNLYDIIDNYKDDFTANYEKENIKGVNLHLEQSKELESRFLNSTGELNIEALKNEATKLPKVLSFREFKEQFRTDAKGNAKVNTRIGEIKINVPKAYNHFVKNTYNVDRKEFSGAFLDTLVNPLFIVRQKYRPKVSLQGKSLQRSNNSLDSKMQNKSRIQIGDKEIIQDSYVFYKPFVSENGLVSLASFAISQNGELLHKTFYDIKTLSKLKKLIKGDDEDLLYFKNEKRKEYKV